MIAAEPTLAAAICDGRVAAAELAEPIAAAVGTGRQVTVVGCGTSEHAAMAVADLLRDALPGPWIAPRQAFEASLDPRGNGLCLAISHEGETPATLAALDAAAKSGADTAIITAAPESRGALLANRRLITPLVDRSWCHTVGYLSPIVAGAAVAAAVSGGALDCGATETHLAEVLDLREEAEKVGRRLWGVDRLVVVGSGLDRISARELALKVEEGVHLPAVGRDLETQLHGHLASADERCGLVVIAVDPSAGDRRLGRTIDLLRAAARLGLRTAAIVDADRDAELSPELTSAGRLVLPAADGRGSGPAQAVPAALRALCGAAVALQLLTVGLAHAAGTNPDLIRREEQAYREAAEIAG